MRATRIATLGIFIAALIAGCGDSSESGWSRNVRDAKNPDGKTPLGGLEVDQIRSTLRATRVEINQMRPIGMAFFLDALKAELDKLGIDATAIGTIDDNTIGKPMPGGTVANQPIGTKKSSLSSRDFALTAAEAQKYYDCPILAPENNVGTECDKVVDAVVVQVKKDLEAKQSQLEQQIKGTYPDLDATSLQFISAWASTAQNFGVTVASVYAKYELKASAACDDKTNAGTVSVSLGREQGWQIVESFRSWALEQVDTCVVNTDDIAEQVRVMSRSQVDEFIVENKICETSDYPASNAALKEAEAKRKTGILEGIDERIEVLRNELFQARTIAPCGGGDGGGDGGDGGGGGEPLAIDLDGDGMTLITERVQFDLLGDGTKQSTTWFGPNEGIVAIDLDGDGAITSAAELMSNHCEGSFCFDGARKLALYDAPERGGNGDGVIDHQDQVWSKLLVWVDANSDGVSQPGELTTFEERGILAVNLEVDNFIQRSAGGTINGKLQVLTQSGVKDAYDVWLNLDIKKENLGALMPR